MDMTMRLGCPIESCTWHHDRPSVADPVVVLNAERLATRHLETHTAIQYANEVSRLRSELADVRRELAVAEQEGWRP